MIALGIILAVLFFIAVLRLGVHGEYSEEGFVLKLKVGLFSFVLYPEQEKPKKEKSDKGKKKNKTATKAQDNKVKKGGNVELIKQLLPEIFSALRKLKKKLLIKRLRIYYMSAAEDPAKAAISYGYASAGVGVIAAIFENNFKIRKRDIRTSVSFEEKKPKVYIDFIMSLAIWEILYIAVPFIIKSLKLLIKSEDSKSEIRKGD